MNTSKTKTIYFITGASGVGKTTLVEQLKKKYGSRPWAFIHFDSIGVPSLQQMEKEFGSPSAWQKAITFKRIDLLVHEHSEEKIFFEGQVDLKFIHEGFLKHHFKNYHLILLDCSEKVMGYRLTYKRAQPELFTQDMQNWLQYFRRQAKASKTIIIDSSNLSAEELLKEFEKAMGL